MKIISIIIISLLVTSCTTLIPYYQVYKTNTPTDITKKGNDLIYEDSNCKIYYNLWGTGGNLNFQFYNKTDEELQVHLDKSYFILNGVAHNYYKNRTYATSVATSKENSTSSLYYYRSTGTSSAKTTTITIQEENIISIPPKTSKRISENYIISKKRYKNCDLAIYPSKKEGKSSLSFDKSDSPFTFSNRISYSLKSLAELQVLEHQFYVSEIINLTEKEMFVSKKDVICGEEQGQFKRYFKDYDKSNFYIKYIRKIN